MVLRLHRSEAESSEPPLERITAALAETTRDADSTGMLGANDFLILAPGTDDEGAAALAKRLLEALNDRTTIKNHPPSRIEFSAGYYAGLNKKGGSLMAEELLERPMEALRTAQRANAAGVVLPFHPA